MQAGVAPARGSEGSSQLKSWHIRSGPQCKAAVGCCALLAILGVLLVASIGSAASLAQPATASKPKVPPGTDPGGIAIGLIGFGVDYTDPEIAPRLARDGEGEIVGWDFVDGDNRPYATAEPQSVRDTTNLGKLMLSAYSRARLVLVRIKPDDPGSMAQAIGFLMQTPARIVAIPLLSAGPKDLDVLLQAAKVASGLLFVVPQGEDHASAVPNLGNVVRVRPASQAEQASAAARTTVDTWIVPRGSTMFGPRAGTAPSSGPEAVALAAAAAACAQHRRAAGSGAVAKTQLLALATHAAGDPALPVIDPQCLYGGQRF